MSSERDALDAGIDLNELMAGEWKPEPSIPTSPGIYEARVSKTPDFPITGYGTKHTDPLTGAQIAREYDKAGRLIGEWRKAPGEDSKWIQVALYTTYRASAGSES